MKKNVLVFGAIAGLIVSTFMILLVTLCYNGQGSMYLGYGSMLAAFSFIFVGVKNYRDKYNDGIIFFGKAFMMGLYIALIASTMYVVSWLICFYCFIPDFIEKYAAHAIAEAQKAGATAAQLAVKKQEMASYIAMYKTPIGVIALTYLEILPVGLIVALIAALILKRKTINGQAVPAL